MLQSPFVVVLGASALVSVAVTTIAARFRHEVGADWFVAMMGLVTVWNALALVSVVARAPDLLVGLHMARVVLSIAVPVVWFTFVLEYTGHGDLLTRRWLALLWTIPAVTFVGVVTFPTHDLYHTAFSVVSDGDRAYARAVPGPLAITAVAYVYGLFVAGFAFLANLIWRRERLFSGQASWLLAGTLVPAVVGLLTVFEQTPQGWPVIPASLTLLGLAYGYGLYRHRLLDLPPASKRIGVADAVDDLDEGVIVVDTDWTVVAINETACGLFDCRKTRVLGRDVSTVHQALGGGRPDDRDRDLEVGGRVLAVSTSSVEDTRGRLAGYVLSVHDVTEQRGRRQRLEVLNRILRHNLRNDMTVVSGYANEIANVGDETVAEMARSIDATADELLDLANKARDIERTLTTAETEPRPVDLSAMIDRLLERMAADCPGGQITVDVPDDLSITTDPDALELVVCNVIENAVQHGLDEGDSGQRTGETGGIVIRARGTDDGVEITVRDHGPGIPATELAVIEAGTETGMDHSQGLGLWLVRWGATRLGADVTFESGDGTTVTLDIPHE